MRKNICIVGCLMLVFLLSGPVRAQGPELELISYNIRMNTPSDGEHAWPHRKENVFSLLRFHRAQVFCVQEALPDQMDDLAEAFPDFAFEGVGRDDGIREGEFSAVFYSKESFKKLEGGTFWLSETPGECSFGWDAACRRVCSWVKLEERSNQRVFYVFNTHFDHKGQEARRNSAGLILKKIDEITAGQGLVVLCGDFNLRPDSEPIALIKERFLDAFELTEMPPYGALGTYHGFSYDDPEKDRIDYVFLSQGIRVLRYAALTDSRNRAFFSDHLPVLVTLSY